MPRHGVAGNPHNRPGLPGYNPMKNAGGYGGRNPGMRSPMSAPRQGGYGMRSPMPTPRRGGYGMRSPMSVPRQGMRRPGMMAGLRRPMAPRRSSRMNPMAMLGMRNRRRNIV